MMLTGPKKLALNWFVMRLWERADWETSSIEPMSAWRRLVIALWRVDGRTHPRHYSREARLAV